MAAHGLGDLVADGEYRIEGGRRLLENHGNPLAAQIRQGASAHGQDLVAFQLDAAGPARAMLGMKPQDRPKGNALARPRFAQDAERLAALHIEADPVDRIHRAIGRDERHV